LKVYARMSLGEKILECVKTTGECNFNAELWPKGWGPLNIGLMCISPKKPR
jgi:hypothetical protein